VCDGTLSSVITAKKCTVSMASLLLPPFNLLQENNIIIRVAAENSLGLGGYSPLSQTTVAKVEAKPTTPTTTVQVDQAATDTQNIKLTWAGLNSPANGGTSITSYNIQWDQGAGTVKFELVGEGSNYTLLTYTVTNTNEGITAG